MIRRAALLDRLARKRQADRMQQARKVSLALEALSRTEAQLGALQDIIPSLDAAAPVPPGALQAKHKLSLVIVEQIDEARQLQDQQRLSLDQARADLAQAELRARLTKDRAQIAKSDQAITDLGT